MNIVFNKNYLYYNQNQNSQVIEGDTIYTVSENVKYTVKELNDTGNGWNLLLHIKDNNAQSNIAFGWAPSAVIELASEEGVIKSTFPAMSKLFVGQEHIYKFNFEGAIKDIRQVIISPVFVYEGNISQREPNEIVIPIK